jgi:hypothetical protein
MTPRRPPGVANKRGVDPADHLIRHQRQAGRPGRDERIHAVRTATELHDRSQEVLAAESAGQRPTATGARASTAKWLSMVVRSRAPGTGFPDVAEMSASNDSALALHQPRSSSDSVSRETLSRPSGGCPPVEPTQGGSLRPKMPVQLPRVSDQSPVHLSGCPGPADRDADPCRPWQRQI